MIVADLNQAAAQVVVDAITSAGGDAVARGFDITDESAYKELIEFTARELEGLDALFNVAADLSARTIGRDTDVLSVPLDVWQQDAVESGRSTGGSGERRAFPGVRGELVRDGR